jgi:hypothetical protein
MNDLRKLLDSNEAYPPSQELWKDILKLAGKRGGKSHDEKILELQEQMRREANKYRPGLPEPEVARFMYNDKFYYLDGKAQIYDMDDDNPMVGNLAGEIRQEGDKIVVIIRGERVKEFNPEGLEMKELEMYGKKYYTNGRDVYTGLHPKHKYVHKMGVLNASNKIMLLDMLPTK